MNEFLVMVKDTEKRQFLVVPPSNICKYSLSLEELKFGFKHFKENDFSLRVQCYGVVGVLCVNEEHFLGVITEATPISLVENHSIFRVENVVFYCLNSAKYEETDQKLKELDMQSLHPSHPVSGVGRLLSSGSYFFSHTLDLSRDLRNRSNHAVLDSGNFSYIWNRNIIADLLISLGQLDISVQNEIKDCGIITPLIQGYVGFYKIMIEEKEHQIGIISRLSCNRAGTRFNARGIDENGNVSNFVETEFLFYYNSKIYSHLQIRGSVPLFWEQEGLQVKHNVTITRNIDQSIEAARLHFGDLITTYEQTMIINLLNSTPEHAEFELRTMYAEVIQKLGNDKVKYHEFDFHKIVHRQNYDRLQQLRNDIQAVFDEYGYTIFDVESGSLSTTQHGVLRTNCLDCLDRTNVVQALILKMQLDRLMNDLELNPSVSESNCIDSAFNNLCADNGDWLSIIYAGTGALKSSVTRNGRPTLSGMLDDGIKSISRQFIHKLQDKGRQESIDLLLGINTVLSLDHKNYYAAAGNAINYTATTAGNALSYTSTTVSSTVSMASKKVTDTGTAAYDGVAYAGSVVKDTSLRALDSMKSRSLSALNKVVSSPSALFNAVSSIYGSNSDAGVEEKDESLNENTKASESKQ